MISWIITNDQVDPDESSRGAISLAFAGFLWGKAQGIPLAQGRSMPLPSRILPLLAVLIGAVPLACAAYVEQDQNTQRGQSATPARRVQGDAGLDIPSSTPADSTSRLPRAPSTDIDAGAGIPTSLPDPSPQAPAPDHDRPVATDAGGTVDNPPARQTDAAPPQGSSGGSTFGGRGYAFYHSYQSVNQTWCDGNVNLGRLSMMVTGVSGYILHKYSRDAICGGTGTCVSVSREDGKGNPILVRMVDESGNESPERDPREWHAFDLSTEAFDRMDTPDRQGYQAGRQYVRWNVVECPTELRGSL